MQAIMTDYDEFKEFTLNELTNMQSKSTETYREDVRELEKENIRLMIFQK